MKKTNSHITPKNLENILKLFLKAQEKKKSRKKRKNYKSKKYLHEQHRNEQQGNIIMTNLNNMIKENQYKQQSGIKQLDDENKIDLSIVKRALEGNPSQAQKLIKYNPSIKPLLENYYKSHESGFLRDIENEIKRREKIYHTRITELEEDGKKLYEEKKYLENFIDEKKKIFFDLEDDLRNLSDKYKQIKLNHEISRTVNKKLEDKIEKSEISLKELNELFKDISCQKDLTEEELNI